MAEVIWSPSAIKDLNGIHDHIAADSVFYAESFVVRIMMRTNVLQDFPGMGHIVPEFGLKNLREIREGNYRIIYSTDTGPVRIVRVHHAARLLSEDHIRV